MKPMTFDYKSIVFSDATALKIAQLEHRASRTTDQIQKTSFYRDLLLHDAYKKATPFFLALVSSPKCYPKAAKWMIIDKTVNIVNKPHVEYRYVCIGQEALIIEIQIANPDPTSQLAQKCDVTGAWSTSKWLPPWHFFAWYWNKEERYQESRSHEDKTPNVKWSPLLAILGWILFWLRRFNLFEFVKHWFPSISGLNQTPARILDRYLLFQWPLLAVIIWYLTQQEASRDMTPSYLAYFFGYWIVQLVQTSVYHEIWRTLRRSPIATEKFVHSRLRNALIGFLNVATVTVLFGLVYYFSEAFELNTNTPEHPVWQEPTIIEAIYFSYTIAWSVGPVAMSPRMATLGNSLVMIQSACTLLLVGVLLSLVVSGITPLEEQ